MNRRGFVYSLMAALGSATLALTGKAPKPSGVVYGEWVAGEDQLFGTVYISREEFARNRGRAFEDLLRAKTDNAFRSMADLAEERWG